MKTEENVAYSYVNGKYQIKNTKANWNYWAYPPVENLGPKYTIEADMIWKTDKEGSYGFIFNEQGSDYYAFKVNPTTQHYTVRRHHEGSWHDVIDWMKSSAHINKSKNHLKLVQDRDKLKIYINNEQMAETKIVEHDETVKVGLLVSKDDKDELPAVVQYDNFKLSGYIIKEEK